MENILSYLYKDGLTKETAQVLEEQGAEAVQRYFSELEEYAPHRALTGFEEVLYMKYVASEKEILSLMYKDGLTEESAQSLEEKGAEAVQEYFSKLEEYAPHRAINAFEQALYVKYVASSEDILAMMDIMFQYYK